MLTPAPLKDLPPGHQRELVALLDQGELAARHGDGSPIDALNAATLRRLLEVNAELSGKLAGDAPDLPLPEIVQQA